MYSRTFSLAKRYDDEGEKRAKTNEASLPSNRTVIAFLFAIIAMRGRTSPFIGHESSLDLLGGARIAKAAAAAIDNNEQRCL